METIIKRAEVEITQLRSEREIAAEINGIKKQVAQASMAAAVEIGRLLCEAKAQVPYGEWGEWLEKNVAYSQSNANNLMRLYQNYGEQEQIGFFEENRMDIFGHLSPSQAVALLGLPPAQRREYVETHDMESTSVRDIEREIQARKQAEERAAEAEGKAENTRRLAEEERADWEAERGSWKEAQAEWEDEKAALQQELEAAREATKPAQELEKMLKEKYQKQLDKKLEKERAALQKEVEDAKKTAEEAEKEKAAAEQRIREEMAAAYAEQLEQLRREKESAAAKLQNAGNAAVQKFSVHFESLQREYDTLRKLAEEIRSEDEAMGEKLAGALARLVTQMAEPFISRYEGEQNA